MLHRYIKTTLFTIAWLAAISCGDNCKVTSSYIYYRPVYSTSDEIRKAVAYEGPRDMKHPGRIYFKDKFLFVNESGEGIHVIDNANPVAPVSKGFLRIPGNNELAIIGNYLYADSYVDLVVFDVGSKNSIHEVGRVPGLFDQLVSYGYNVLSENIVLTGWKQEKTVQIDESKCTSGVQPWGGLLYEDGIAFSSASQGAPAGGMSAGIGGSTARFTISGNYLYALNGGRLEIAKLTSPASPVQGRGMDVSRDIETLFPSGNKLFAGSASGMFIYDLANPENPRQISKYEHIRSCDPVVVDDAYAYVTLRSGRSCQGFTNQLEVISLQNLSAPTLVKTYPMTNPSGLGIDHHVLFICDGSAGLKVFDASDINNIDSHLLAGFSGINPVDIIPFENTAMVITSDGLYQYDYTDVKNIRLLSKLPIAR
jgi:hypothetical protein